MSTAKMISDASGKKEGVIIKGDIVDLKVTYADGKRVVTEVEVK
tara:strand:+ start:326 stop:457 length:132 start_codon:yes stop_codon:yes gene_type:complete